MKKISLKQRAKLFSIKKIFDVQDEVGNKIGFIKDKSIWRSSSFYQILDKNFSSKSKAVLSKTMVLVNENGDVLAEAKYCWPQTSAKTLEIIYKDQEIVVENQLYETGKIKILPKRQYTAKDKNGNILFALSYIGLSSDSLIELAQDSDEADFLALCVFTADMINSFDLRMW
ncbi:MAG: hypothetical protein WCP91_02135 [Candidatus Berkelbacteria bacterium]